MKVRLIVVGLFVAALAAADIFLGSQENSPSASHAVRTAQTRSSEFAPTAAVVQTLPETPDNGIYTPISTASFNSACDGLKRYSKAALVEWEAEEEYLDDETGTVEAPGPSYLETRERERQRTTVLSASSDPEISLLAALRLQDNIDRGALLQATAQGARIAGASIDRGISDPALVFAAFQLCARAQDDRACDLERLTARALEVDPGNAHVWAGKALHLHRNGKTGMALQAMQQAATATTATTHWADTVEVLVRASTSLDGTELWDRIRAARSHARKLVPEISEIAQMCRQGKDDARWKDACVGYGTLIQQTAITALDWLHGYRIFDDTYAAVGDQDTLIGINRQRTARSSGQSAQRRGLEPLYFGLAHADAELFSLLMQLIRTEGEFEAELQLGWAIQQFAQVHPELDCVPAFKALSARME